MYRGRKVANLVANLIVILQNQINQSMFDSGPTEISKALIFYYSKTSPFPLAFHPAPLHHVPWSVEFCHTWHSVLLV